MGSVTVDVERELVIDPPVMIELSLSVNSVRSLAGDLTMNWSFGTKLGLIKCFWTLYGNLCRQVGTRGLQIPQEVRAVEHRVVYPIQLTSVLGMTRNDLKLK